MNPRYRTAALLLLIGLSLSAFATPALAVSGQPNALVVAPGEPYGLPRFGFSSSTIYGYGERIVSVRPFGRAARLGLEPGDVILSLNGYRLTYTGSWNDALSQAVSNGGYVRLAVRDVRSGRVHWRETYLGGDGPVTPHYSTGGTITSQPHFVTPYTTTNHTQGSNRTIREIAQLFN
jgi:hypothetical protein